jgi:hypothetical protein
MKKKTRKRHNANIEACMQYLCKQGIGHYVKSGEEIQVATGAYVRNISDRDLVVFALDAEKDLMEVVDD